MKVIVAGDSPRANGTMLPYVFDGVYDTPGPVFHGRYVDISTGLEGTVSVPKGRRWRVFRRRKIRIVRYWHHFAC